MEAPWLRWPMWYRLRPCDLSFVDEATEVFDESFVYDATPAYVHRTFFGFLGHEPWSPGFVGVRWLTPPAVFPDAIMDEHYTFMAMRVRVIEHVPDRRSVAWVDRWSLPLATRMLQIIETTPTDDGRTQLRYRVLYDVPAPFRAFHPPVQAAFRAWFRASFRGLERYIAKYPDPDWHRS